MENQMKTHADFTSAGKSMLAELHLSDLKHAEDSSYRNILFWVRRIIIGPVDDPKSIEKGPGFAITVDKLDGSELFVEWEKDRSVPVRLHDQNLNFDELTIHFDGDFFIIRPKRA